MDNIPVYLPVREEEIRESLVYNLDRLLAGYYWAFAKLFVLGITLVMVGLFVLSVNTVVGLFLLIPGAVAIVLAFRRKINIKRLDISVYPILALPYGDMKRSILFDLQNDLGEDVTVRISRLEKIGDELQRLASMMYNIRHSINQEESALSEKLVIEGERRESVNPEGVDSGVKRIFESLVIGTEGESMVELERAVFDLLVRMKNTLDQRDYEIHVFKLFKPGSNLNLFPATPLVERYIQDISKTISVEDFKVRVDMVLESLKTRYLDILDAVDREVNELVPLMSKYYERAIEFMRSSLYPLHKYMLTKFDVRICSNCVRKEAERIIKSEIMTPIPLLDTNLAWGDPTKDEIVYVCPICRSEYFERVYDTGSGDRFEKIVKIPYVDILELKVWRNVYVNTSSDINRVISDAAARKREKAFEAIRNIHSIHDQIRSQVIPLYLQLSRSFYKVLAFNRTIEGFKEVISANMLGQWFVQCMSWPELERVGRAIDSAKSLLGITGQEGVGGSLVQMYEEKIMDQSSLKVASVTVNETLIDILAQVLSEEESIELRQAYKEGDLGKIEKLLVKKKSGVS